MGSAEARALRLFDRYAEMDQHECEAALEALKLEDPDLHDALSLLLAADAVVRPLDRAPVAAVAAVMQARSSVVQDERIGRKIGPWSIVGVIGQGGMGTVYRVERADDQYQQTAALKYVRADVSSEKLLKAFREERNVLASLSHPDIVPLLDGGVDENGQPWFVMQYVDGDPIDLWCNQRKLSIRARIQLFVQACDSIVHAHRRGILHQDIKPSNLLVTHDGRVQLLDFGLSAPITAERNGKRLAMTSGYTAPEVLKGEVPGLAVDVYSLGILLSHLLCGNLPVSIMPAKHQAHSPSSLVDGMTPSMLAARAVPNSDSLKKILSGELDSIALHCIQENPNDRYESVEELREDLKNWLSGHPVSAHDTGIAYRSLCFIRRNIYLSVTVCVIVAALTIIGGSWFWQRSLAEREQLAASHVDRLLETSIGMTTLSGMGDMPVTPAAQLLRSEEYLRSEALREHDDVRSRGLSVLARNWAAIGDYGKAEALAEEVRQAGAGNVLLSAFNMATLAQIQNLQAHHAEAEASSNEGLALLPLKFSDQHQLARVRLMGQLAAAQSGQGRSPAAFVTLSSAIELAEQLSKESGDAIVAQLLIQRGTWYRWRHEMAKSDADLQRAIELTQETDPVIADDARESLIRTVRASRSPGREVRSLQLAEDLLESRQRTLGENKPQTGSAWAELAVIRLLNADSAGAQVAVDKARGILRETVGEAHPAYARAVVAQAFITTLSGQTDTAIKEIKHGIEIYESTYGSTHELTLEARFWKASLYMSKFSRTSDEAWRNGAIDLVRAAIGDSVDVHGDVASIHRLAFAGLLAGIGKIDEAREQMAVARQDAIRQYGADSQESLHVRSSQIGLEISSGANPAWIEREFHALFEDTDKIDTLYARSIAHSAWLQHGHWMAGQNRVDEARESYRHARQEAVNARQEAWIQVADIRLGELEKLVAGQSK